MQKFKKIIIISIPLIIAVTALIILLNRNEKPKEEYFTGIVDASHIDISSKLAGRIDSLFVKEGDYVRKGQIVAIIRSKEMDAKLEQTRSIKDAAFQKLQMALNGARPEEKEMAEKLYLQAKLQFDLSSTTYKRILKLFNDSLISAQEKDQIEYQFKASKEQMDAAKSKYELVLKGARNEEIMMAEANFRQAESAFREVLAYDDELTIFSPGDGEINKKVIDAGEIVSAGYPIFTVLDLYDTWIVLQIREDKMSRFQKDSVFKGVVPALDNKEFEFAVTYIAPMGEFATWKPTNQKGEFDLKTFEIRLRPKNKINGLRPGMTVNIKQIPNTK